MALSPGETAAFGFVGERPVLLIPGRLDAALAVWLMSGGRCWRGSPRRDRATSSSIPCAGAQDGLDHRH